MATVSRQRRRAITLAGGGPAAGLHIGALARLEKENIEFDVWSLSCIGAWVGIVYHQFDPPDRALQTYRFFQEHIFRDDESYASFPVNRAFGADANGFAKAVRHFLVDPESYRRAFVPRQILDALVQSVQFWSSTRWLNEGDRNAWWHNQVAAAHPFSRFLTALMYLSNVNGLTKLLYPESTFNGLLKFPQRIANAKPEIYHNAWDLGRRQMQLFHNRPTEEQLARGYRPISMESLCACSALPFVEQTVSFDNTTYCEGALVDTVNFKNLLEDHQAPHTRLDEIWVSRIVDVTQVREPQNLHDGLSNLCMLFPAEVGENDIKLFKHHLRKSRRRGPRVVDIPIARNTRVDFRWNHGNLERAFEEGYAAVDGVLTRHRELAP